MDMATRGRGNIREGDVAVALAVDSPAFFYLRSISSISRRPRRAIVIVVLVSTAFIFLQSKSIDQNKVHYSDEAIIKSLDGGIFPGYSFSQVFGGANATNDAANSPPDQPPPEKTWLLNPKSFVPTDANAIPRTINKIFFQKGSGFSSADGMPANLTAAHKSWEAMNPGYVVRYFDLDQARKYLHQYFHPVFLRAFDCLPAFAIKSDLFRMALLYHEGGWYSDWKQVCLQKYVLQNISEVTDIFAVYDLIRSNDFFPHKCVVNAFVGSKPQHPIIATILEMILINVQTMHYPGMVLDTTGPCVFGRAVHQSEEARESKWFSQVAGQFVNHPKYGAAFEWQGEAIVKHKCFGCGEIGQDWGTSGNNYILFFKYHQFYCQDAASLFSTTMV